MRSLHELNNLRTFALSLQIKLLSNGNQFGTWGWGLGTNLVPAQRRT